jgi:hypothetical protein
VGRRGVETEGLDHLAAQGLDLVVARGAQTVGGDEHRRDLAVTHRLEHAGVVVGDELVRHLPADGDGVEEAFVALDELLDRHRGALAHASLGERSLELGVAVHPAGARGAGTVARLDDQGVAHPLCEGEALGHGVDARRLSTGNARAPEELLHRRLVPAQVGGLDRGAGDAAGLAHPCHVHHVGLDSRLEPVDPAAALEIAHRLDHRLLVHHRTYLLEVGQNMLQITQRVGRVLADGAHARTDIGESLQELTLVERERRLDEDDVHKNSLVSRG